MKIIKTSQVPSEPVVGPIYAGGQATTQHIIEKESGSKFFRMVIMNFPSGARTKLHLHTTDQILIITAGKGIVATVEGETVVEPGDVIYAPAGEKHWHGAAKDSAVTWIGLKRVGCKTTQIEK